jgi:uncharacterized membrane protein YkvI
VIDKVRSFIVPAAVFQSVIVGGAYGTGREVVEFISSYGALGGLLVICVIAVGFSLILAVSFEFARTFAVWDYRHFLRELLGRGWVAYELMFGALLIIILAVTGAAAGRVLHDAFYIPTTVGVGLLFALVVALNFFGREIVKQTLTVGAIVLSTVLLAYCALVFADAGGEIVARITLSSVEPGWWLSGMKFAVYNSALIPVIVYCASDVPDRATAIGAGLLAGFLGIFPALIFHLTFIAGYPEVVDQAIPTYWMLERIGVALAVPVYVIVLFATIVQTGVGVLQGLNERLDGWFEDAHGSRLPPSVHALIAGAVLVASLFLSKLGIVALVARGYGTLAWGFFAVFTIPVITIGVRKIRAAGSPPGRGESGR